MKNRCKMPIFLGIYEIKKIEKIRYFVKFAKEMYDIF